MGGTGVTSAGVGWGVTALSTDVEFCPSFGAIAFVPDSRDHAETPMIAAHRTRTM